jgi:hypothetical protein
MTPEQQETYQRDVVASSAQSELVFSLPGAPGLQKCKVTRGLFHVSSRLTMNRASVTSELKDQAFIERMACMRSSVVPREGLPREVNPEKDSKSGAAVRMSANGTRVTLTPRGPSRLLPKPPGTSLQPHNQIASQNVERSTQSPILMPPAEQSFDEERRSSKVSLHTEGVESAASFPSADFASDQGKEDLLLFDQEDDKRSRSPESQRSISKATSIAASSTVSLLDDTVNLSLSQTSLIPSPSLAPRSLRYRGTRYVRADLVVKDSHIALKPQQEIEVSGQGHHQPTDRSRSSSDLTSALAPEPPPGKIKAEVRANFRTDHDESPASQPLIQFADPGLSSTAKLESAGKSEALRSAAKMLEDTTTNRQALHSPPNLAASKYARTGVTVITGRDPTGRSNRSSPRAEISPTGSPHLLSENTTIRSSSPQSKISTIPGRRDIGQASTPTKLQGLQDEGCRQEEATLTLRPAAQSLKPRQSLDLTSSMWSGPEVVPKKETVEIAPAGRAEDSSEDASTTVLSELTEPVKRHSNIPQVQPLLQENIATPKVVKDDDVPHAVQTSGAKFSVRSPQNVTNPDKPKLKLNLMASKYATKPDGLDTAVESTATAQLANLASHLPRPKFATKVPFSRNDQQQRQHQHRPSHTPLFSAMDPDASSDESDL